MKTRILAIVAIIIFSTSGILKAQTLEEETVVYTNLRVAADYQTKTVIWGIKGNLGAELPYAKWTRGSDRIRMFNSGFGASIGALANIYLDRGFYFEPEIAFFYEGYSYNNVMQVAPNSPSINAGPNLHKLGFRIPAVFGYYIGISDKWGLNVFTGPQFSFAFYGVAKTQNEDVKANYDFNHVFKGAYAQRRWDIGWKVGVGFPVNNFLISFEGDFGITDMLKAGTLRENRVSLGVTYYFVNP